MKILLLGVIILLILTGCGDTNKDQDVNSNDTTLPPLLTMTPPEFSSPSGHPINTKSWMANLRDDLSIADITIPGTHDSAAWDDDNVVDSAYKVIAQTKSINEQLELGIRWFDLRVEVDDDNLIMTHEGHDLGMTLGNVLEDLKNYGKSHRSEVIMITIKQESSDLDNSKFAALVRKKIDANGRDHFTLGPTLFNLGEVRGKVVVFRRFKVGDYNKAVGRYLYFKDQTTGTNHNNGDFQYYVQDYYHVDQAEHEETNYWYKAKLVRNAMNEAQKKENEGRLFINFATAYDTGDTNRYVARYLNDKVDGFAKDMKGKGKAGTIFINFAGTTGDNLVPTLTQHIIEINDFDTTPWSKDMRIAKDIGRETTWGGIAMGDVNGDSVTQLISFYIDNPKGENVAYYNVSSSIKTDGTVNSWDNRKQIPGHFGAENAGAGITLGDINGDGHNEIVVFFIDKINNKENNAYYILGAPDYGQTLEEGQVEKDGYIWNNRKKINVHFGTENQGAGITMNDIDGDGSQNLIILYVDNPNDANKLYYRVSSSIDEDGKVDSWSKAMEIQYNDGSTHFGSVNQGAGISIGDIDGDGGQNLVISFIDNRRGENAAYYMVSSNISKDGTVDSWSKREQIYGWTGSENSGAGITMGDLDNDNREDLILYLIDNPDGQNSNYYKVGFNKKLDNTNRLEK